MPDGMNHSPMRFLIEGTVHKGLQILVSNFIVYRYH